MSESSTPKHPDVIRWTMWVVGALAMALGAVLWWAIGGSIDDAAIGSSDGPAHALQPRGCKSQSLDSLHGLGSLLLLGAGVTLIVKAVRRGHWWSDIGLWLGLLLTFDGLLMTHYLMLVTGMRGCD